MALMTSPPAAGGEAGRSARDSALVAAAAQLPPPPHQPPPGPQPPHTDAADHEECQPLLLQMRSPKLDHVTMEMDSPASVATTTTSTARSSFSDAPGERRPDVASAAATKASPNDERFETLLQRAKEEDLTDLENSNCLYRAGYDKQGRAVIVCVGKWANYSHMDLEKALLFLIRELDPVSDHDYVVVYFHTKTSRDNIPSYWWIREVYNSLTYKYKKHLKAFYVIHPTLWTKMTLWWFSTFMAPAIKNKIFNIEKLTELSAFVDHRTLSIPVFVTEQDMVFNGLRYYEP